MHKRRILIPIFIILALTITGGWYLTRQSNEEKNGILRGSGTVEAVEVAIAPEMGGRVAEVLVRQGDVVKVDDPLFRLDDDLLEAQHQQALAALDTAQAGLVAAQAARSPAQIALELAHLQAEQARNAAHLQEQPSCSGTWSLAEPEDFILPGWYFNKGETMQAVQAELQAAEVGLEVEQENYAAVINAIGKEELVEADARLAQTQAAYLVAQEILARAQGQDDQLLLDYAQEEFDNAQAELLASQEAYDALLPEQDREDVLQARAHLALAQERYDTALDHYNRLLTGDESLQVEIAETAVQQAQAALDLVDAQIGQAQAALAQTQAQLELVETQMKRLLVSASVPGVILSRNIEPGEVIQPGSVALNIGQLDELTITVFIPEDRYGEVELGMPARVSVDSFPGEFFDAVVTHIADQAEFTPRNVQTEEGRRSTVYAIKLSVDDPARKLKPGMPADVIFEE